MLTKQQVRSIPPAPFEPVFKIRRIKVDGKIMPIKVPVMEYNPQTGKKVQKRARGSYTTSQLNKMFPDQKRNKTIAELLSN